jgi:hypothetical protein
MSSTTQVEHAETSYHKLQNRRDDKTVRREGERRVTSWKIDGDEGASARPGDVHGSRSNELELLGDRNRRPIDERHFDA